MEEKKSKFGITKPVFVVSVVSFLNDIASDMVYPIVPIFLTTVLGAPVAVMGLIEGIAESTSSFLRVASGVASDKMEKRKPFIIMGYIFSATSKLFYAAAIAWPMVMAGKFIDRLGKGTRTSARDAFIAEHTEDKHKGRAFGFHRSMDTMGAAVGPLIGVFLLSYFQNDFKTVFLVSLVPTIFALFLLFFFVRDDKPKLSEIKIKLPFKEILKKLPKPLLIFLVVNCIFAIGNSSDAFIILRANDLLKGDGILEATKVSMILYAIFSLSYALFSIPAGIISDKIGQKRVILFGFIIFAVVYMMFGFSHNSSLLWLLFPIYGMYMALTDGVGKAYIANIIGHEHLGSAYGIYQFAIGFCAFFSSLIAGVLWQKVGVAAPFVFGGVMAILAALIFMFYKKELK